MTTDTDRIRKDVMDALGTIYDPEVPVDIVSFGLIYGLDVDEQTKDVKVTMSLTSQSCPSAQSLPAEAERKTKAVEGVGEVEVSVVWDPPWGPEMISPEGRKRLGMD